MTGFLDLHYCFADFPVYLFRLIPEKPIPVMKTRSWLTTFTDIQSILARTQKD